MIKMMCVLNISDVCAHSAPLTIIGSTNALFFIYFSTFSSLKISPFSFNQKTAPLGWSSWCSNVCEFLDQIGNCDLKE